MSADDRKDYSEYSGTELAEMKVLAQEVHDKTIRLAQIVSRVTGYHDAHVAFTHASAFQLLQVMQGCCAPMCSSTLALVEQIDRMQKNNGNI